MGGGNKINYNIAIAIFLSIAPAFLELKLWSPGAGFIIITKRFGFFLKNGCNPV